MKKLIIIGILIVIVVTGVLFLGISNLGPMIKTAVNSYGPSITDTPLQMEDVNVSLFSAEAKIQNFFLGNPQGFQSPDAMKVALIHVDVDEKSLTGDTIIIDRVEVVEPEITYIKTSKTDNFSAILANVKKNVGAEKSGSAPAESDDGTTGKKLVIREFIIRGGKVNLVASVIPVGKPITASLPDLRLENLGQKHGGEEGATPAAVFQEVFTALHRQITSPAVTDMLAQGLTSAGITVQGIGTEAQGHLQTMSGGAKKGLDSVTGKIKGLFGD